MTITIEFLFVKLTLDVRKKTDWRDVAIANRGDQLGRWRWEKMVACKSVVSKEVEKMVHTRLMSEGQSDRVVDGLNRGWAREAVRDNTKVFDCGNGTGGETITWDRECWKRIRWAGEADLRFQLCWSEWSYKVGIRTRRLANQREDLCLSANMATKAIDVNETTEDETF